jgi:hypothetical protein
MSIRTVVILTLVLGGWFQGGCSQREKPQTAEEYLQSGDRLLDRKDERHAYILSAATGKKFDSEYKAQAQLNIAESLHEELPRSTFEYQNLSSLSYPPFGNAQFQIGVYSIRYLEFDRDQRKRRRCCSFRLFRQYPQDPWWQRQRHTSKPCERVSPSMTCDRLLLLQERAYHAAIGRLLNLIQVYLTMPDLDAALYMLADSHRAEENYVKAQRYGACSSTIFLSVNISREPERNCVKSLKPVLHSSEQGQRYGKQSSPAHDDQQYGKIARRPSPDTPPV